MDIFALIAVIIIESTGNPMEFHQKELAIGALQVRPVCLRDYNNYHPVKYQPKDMFKLENAVQVFLWYTGYWGDVYEKKTGHTPSVDTLIRIWNGGPDGYNKNSTDDYSRRFNSYYINIKNKRKDVIYSYYVQMANGRRLNVRDVEYLIK